MYQSPLHIIPNYDFNRLQPKEIKRLKKELLLRFELKKTTQISINNYSFDKKTILKNIEDLAQYGAFHQQIFQSPRLLNFLEKGRTECFEKDYLESFFAENNQIDYIKFLQPYFSQRLNQTIYCLVTNSAYQNLQKLKRILSNLEDVPSSYLEGAFVKVHQHLVATDEKLKQLQESNQIFEKQLGWVVATKAFNQVFHFTYLKKLELLPYDLEGQLLELVDTLLHIVQKIMKTITTDVIKIDKGLILDVKDFLDFAYKKRKHKDLIELQDVIDKILKNPYYNILEMGSLFFRSIR